jgi:hypothetical protein
MTAAEFTGATDRVAASVLIHTRQTVLQNEQWCSAA